MAAPGQTPSDSGVAELQRVLKAYVQVTGYTPADPGTVDGIVGVKTAMAVIAMLPRVPGIPEEVRAMAPVLSIMLATDDGKTQVYRTIKNNASTIAKAIIALEAYRVGTSSGSPATTATSTAIATNTFFNPGAIATAGGAIPGDPRVTIWFYDGFRKVYRVAVPKAGLAGFSNYVEVSPSASLPAYGTQVSRNAFMSATGRWWGTYPGMAGIGVGVIAATAVAYRAVRAVL
jgi:hypothetical protein